jgi:DNA repair protein RecO (recombination protein O)
LDVFSVIEVMLARGRNLDVITQVERVPGPRLGADVGLTAHAGLIAEVADRVCSDRHPMEGVFELTAAALESLAVEGDGRRVSAYFLGRALDLFGYAVQVDVCASCDRKLEAEPSPFSAAAGGVLCPSCALPGMPLTSVAALKVLKVVTSGDAALYARLKLSEQLLVEVEDVLEAQIEHHLEGRLKSLTFLRQMR